MNIRIVLADDHAVLRRGLRMLLESEPDIEVVGEADNGAAAVDEVLRQAPDVVLMDLSMPEMDGLAATERLHEHDNQVHVVILSGAEEDSTVVSAVRAGAIGYLPKTAPLEDMLRTVRSAARGQVTFSASASARLVRELHTPAEEPEHLTDREMEVLGCITDGLSNKAIAWKLRISEKTVKSHVSTILGKFGLESRTQAALHATRVGLLRTERTTTHKSTPGIVSLDNQRRARRAYDSRSACAAMS
jgi:DNA-binding NarL/FixJ family response regulator